MSIQWPTLSRTAPREVEFRLLANSQTFRSPLTQSAQTLELPGARWSVSFTLSALTEADAAILQAFLVSLDGQAGRFTLHNFARPQPRGVATGTPLVKGSGQTGKTLITDGWTAGVTGILKAGDFIGVNGELKMVIADANSDGTGTATLAIRPALRASPADNAPITIDRPTATFMLTEDSVQWLTRPGLRSDFPIAAVETWL